MSTKALSFIFKILLFFAGGVLRRLLTRLSGDVRQEAEQTLRALAVQAKEKTPNWPWDDELVRFCQRVAGFSESSPTDDSKAKPEDTGFHGI
jgi:hypothetical protein